ncbi:MAG: hypothetical protein WB239_00010 [Acidimicrobiia bacterium]
MTLQTDKPKGEVKEPIDVDLAVDNRRFMTFSLIVLAIALIGAGVWLVFWGL